ncbi:MAG: sigma-70 family RNA polymerase sigma factor [Candidatus Aminicenantes bacterium]|nr:sigma-70 family RNA polymerase sigma factor [Candidatus Aminicenantes bacterium]
MFFPVVAKIHQAQSRISVAHSVTMELNAESQIMTEGERDLAKGISLSDSFFLKDAIKRSREGDIQALEAIYKHFSRPLFNVVYRYTYNREIAEDLLQDIFLKIFSHLQDIRNEDTFVGWIYRIAVNTCYSYLRGKKIQLQRTIPLSDVERTIEGKSHQSSNETVKKSLDNAIQRLPNKMKSIFLLHDVQGFKHQEISRMLGCSLGTSKSQLFKARMKIREYLENEKTMLKERRK